MGSRDLILAAAVVLGSAAGCASVLGLDFDAYREGKDAGPVLDCIPNRTNKCECGLDTGFQTCSDAGKLGPCQCSARDAGDAEAGAACGDSVVDEGEVCDDGNVQPGDGCSERCVPDGRPLDVEDCPGQNVSLWRDTDLALAITGFSRGASVDGGACGVLGRPDRVYAIQPTSPFEVTVTSSDPVAVSIRTTCADPGSAQTCDVVAAGGSSSPRRIEAASGQTFYLIVEPRQASTTATTSLHLRSVR